MEIDKLNSLVELYFKKCEEVDPKIPFLKWLKPGKPTYTWGDIKERIFKLSSKIKSLIKVGDRCLILSENRPYWLMADIAVMNAGGISVPIFTTYSSNDYEYILNDCKPSLIIVSNNDQFKKIKNHINLKEQILGMNASSISEITGIPRATVIRKLKISEKTGMIYKDNRQLYTIGKSYKSKLKDLGKVFSENQVDLCKFVSTFFELFRNPTINKNIK